MTEIQEMFQKERIDSLEEENRELGKLVRLHSTVLLVISLAVMILAIRGFVG